ncbi:unnamed protein product [Brassica rapa]|uniref:Uncharacterized protein n=1 Tax=Brassica campestris TaxID=3711 RepID=A0A8D9HY40_BRACM|nr:unnamed protein product [Brassica rapa]
MSELALSIFFKGSSPKYILYAPFTKSQSRKDRD